MAVEYSQPGQNVLETLKVQVLFQDNTLLNSIIWLLEHKKYKNKTGKRKLKYINTNIIIA